MKKNVLQIYRAEILLLPITDGGSKTEFRSLTEDFIDFAIDLNKELGAPPSSTFYVCVRSDSK